MIKDDQYIAFKERSKKHMSATLNSFQFWGMRVGRINGQIKSKWGETRWYADLNPPTCLYEIIHVSEFGMRDGYKWDPSKGAVNKSLDVINNMSKFFSIMLYVFALYKLFFYNVAYWVAILKNRDCASDIVWSADHPSKILLGKKYADVVYKRNERLLTKK